MRKNGINTVKTESCAESDATYSASDFPVTASDLPVIYDQRVGRLPERLKAAIGDRSTRSIAGEADVSEGTVRNVLNGGIPKLDSILRIADAAGVSASWLATGEGHMRPSAGQMQHQGGRDGEWQSAFSAVSADVSGVKAAVALAVAALSDHGQTIRPERLADLIDAAHQALQAGTDPALVRRLIAAAANP